MKMNRCRSEIMYARTSAGLRDFTHSGCVGPIGSAPVFTMKARGCNLPYIDLVLKLAIDISMRLLQTFPAIDFYGFEQDQIRQGRNSPRCCACRWRIRRVCVASSLPR